MLNHLKLIISFLKHPEERLEEVHKTSSKLKWFFGLIVLNLVLVYMASFIQRLPSKFGFVDPGQNKVFKQIANGNIYILLLLICLIGPIIEELIFRLPLRLKKYNFIPFIVFGVLLNGAGIVYQQLNQSLWFIIIPVSITIVALFVNFSPYYFNKISDYLKSNYSWYFYIVAMLFAFMHIFNYEFSWRLIIFVPIIVLPQLTTGLILGFTRIKLGFFWGVLFHSIHNLIFMLPVYLILNSVNHVHLPEIKNDGYTIEIAEKGDSVYFGGGSNITPNEIRFSGTLKEVLSKFSSIRKENIYFIDIQKGEKQISVFFRNDSAYDSPSTVTARHLVMEHLTEKYNLKMDRENRDMDVYLLRIENPKLFQRYQSDKDSLKPIHYYRSFYGKNDTIELSQINSKYLKETIEKNYGILIDNEIDRNKVFSVKIPNDKINNTAKYLKENYGIGLKYDMRKKYIFIVR